jgi:hypothetical protein
MVTYTCDRCNYTTNHKTKFTRHQNRKNKCKNISENVSNTQFEYLCLKSNPLGNPDYFSDKEKNVQNEDILRVIRLYPKMSKNEDKISSFQKINLKNEKYICRFCNENFTKKQNRWRHEKYRCPQNKNVKKNKKITIDEDKIKLKLLSYNKTNRQFLTDEMISICMQKQNRCIPEMIKLVHFSEVHPENMNILIRNLNNESAVIYDGKSWEFFDKDNLLNKIIKDSQSILEKKFMEWYNDVHLSIKYKEAISKFEQYLNVSSNQQLIDSIKNELKLLCYNIKNKIDINNTGYIVTEVIE